MKTNSSQGSAIDDNSEDHPPAYEEVCQQIANPQSIQHRSNSPPDSLDYQVEQINRAVENLDLLSHCKNGVRIPTPEESVSLEDGSNQQTIPEMGQTTSILTGKHKSKVSLTWVLREKDFRFNSCNDQILSESSVSQRSPVDSYQNRFERNNNYYEHPIIKKENDYFNKDKLLNNHRVIGRNVEQNKHLTSIDTTSERKILKSNRNINQSQDSWSECDKSVEVNPLGRKHKHRRKKKNLERRHKNFGYEIKDIERFLAEASIDNPGNIPVVVTYPSILYQTRTGSQQTELPLSLGMVVNAVFKNQQWLYVQTPHGEEGYILYTSCLPLGILPPPKRSAESSKSIPCWESTWDLYPPPCGNMTDSEKENYRGGTRSECGRPRHKTKANIDNMSVYSEKIFDKLYIRATSSCSKQKDFSCDDVSLISYSTTKTINDFNLKNKHSFKNNQLYDKRFSDIKNTNSSSKVTHVSRHTLLVVEKDYQGSKSINSLSVNKGDVVILMEGYGMEADVDSEWYYIRNKDGEEGFIPAFVAGHGYL